jgi:hypothetical protein
LVVLHLPVGEDLVAGEVVEGREDVAEPQDRPEEGDERLLRASPTIGATRGGMLLEQLGDLRAAYSP